MSFKNIDITQIQLSFMMFNRKNSVDEENIIFEIMNKLFKSSARLLSDSENRKDSNEPMLKAFLMLWS